MSLLFFEGFDHMGYGEDLYKWEYVGAGPSHSAGGRTGTGSVWNGLMAKYVAPYDANFIVGFACTGAMTCHICPPENYNALQVYLTITAYGSIRVVGSGDVTLAESAAGVFRNGAWNYIEWKGLIANSGTVVVKCNGATVINASGIDTQAQSHTNWGWVKFSFYSVSLDDIYICDAGGTTNNDLLGEVRVITLLPQTDAVGGAGANADFTPSTGTDHGALVDEASPNSDTDYVSSATPNHVDTWNYPALGYTGTIKGVRLNLFAKKADSGTRAIAAVARPVSTNRLGDDKYLTTSYTYWAQQWELNPEDSAAWEVADIDGAEFGVKITV